jgi:hypothetical protein
MLSVRSVVKFLLISLLIFSAGNKFAFAQNVSRLSGIVVDQNGALIAGVEITLLSSGGTLERTVFTDSEGFFDFPYLPPDEYSLKISKEGFDPSEIPNLLVSAENARQLKIELKINPIAETIKVEGESAPVDQNKAGSTTFEQTALENFPLNGRNFQSLINLVPGVVFTPVDNKNLGQFSSNGQRTNANFFTVDGVSANFGTTNYDFLGQTGSGSIPSMNIQGGLDNLISAEALQEVKVQTLDFAPATGKMPGANVSFVSRSGGNDFSFSVFENFRNAAFNAKDYFDIEKPPHNFNDFGGSFGGPLAFLNRKQNSNNQTYFFLAFEGKRFTLPQATVITEVPSLEIRKDTPNEVAQAIYNSFPLPNEKDKPTPANLLIQSVSAETTDSSNVFFPETAPFRATYSDPNSFENYNLRIDHIFNPKITFFGRFNYSPSFAENRNPANLSSFITSRQITRSLTFGSTQSFSNRIVNELRFNLSKQSGNTNHDFDGRYGGILPDKSIFIPKAFEEDKTHFRFSLNGFPDSLVFFYGNYAQNEMRQLNFSDDLSFSFGNHEIKLGVDYRELSPTLRASGYGIDYDFNSAESISAGTANRVSFYKNPNVSTKVSSISSFIQDTWKVNSGFNLVYGLRWEIDPAPSTEEKNALLTLENPPDLNQADQTKLRLAPAGTPYYRTSFRNFAPRLGAAIEIFNKNDKQFVLRGGVGTFYDLGQSQFNEIASPFEHTNDFAENLILPINNFPFGFLSNSPESNKRPAVISAVSDYRLPRTFFWNLTAQLKAGNNLFSTSYIGGAGRRLQRTLTLNLLKPTGTATNYFSNNFSKVIYIDNAYSSDYHSLQFQYSRNLSSGLKSFVNYVWSHSIDNNSSDSNLSTPFLSYPVSQDRGNSDFDVRHVFNAGFSYDLPSVKSNNLIGKFLQSWTIGGIFFARTGLPYDVKTAEFNPLTNEFDFRRADVADGLPLLIKAAESPIGYRVNAGAFTKPDNLIAQGNLGRNVLTGPSVWQFDSSLGKKFNLTEKLQLQLRVEIYNIFNHPNFSNPQAKILYQAEEKIITKDFGVPTKTMARGYASAEPTGGVSPIFQLGGARIMQFNVRIKF